MQNYRYIQLVSKVKETLKEFLHDKSWFRRLQKQQQLEKWDEKEF